MYGLCLVIFLAGERVKKTVDSLCSAVYISPNKIHPQAIKVTKGLHMYLSLILVWLIGNSSRGLRKSSGRSRKQAQSLGREMACNSRLNALIIHVICYFRRELALCLPNHSFN